MTHQISHEELTKLLSYDTSTGEFRWKECEEKGPIWNGKLSGKTAGCQGRYVEIGLCGKTYKAHRLAWFYVTKEWPFGEVDHINCIKTDNRFSNLRVVTRSQNMMNRGWQRNNQIGLKGVSFHRQINKWVAQIRKDGRNHYLGSFVCPYEAHSAYESAASGMFGEYHRPT